MEAAVCMRWNLGSCLGRGEVLGDRGDGHQTLLRVSVVLKPEAA